MLKDWETQLITLRKEKRWDDIYDLLDQLLPTVSGQERGRVKLQIAHTRYVQSPEHARGCLDLIDQALELAAGDNELEVRCLILGYTCALYALDTERVAAYAERTRAIGSNENNQAYPWFGRLVTWQGYHQQSEGKYRGAVQSFRQAVDFYHNNVGPYGESDRACQLVIARTALGDALWASGKRSEAIHELRGAAKLAVGKSAAVVAYLQGRITSGEGRLREAEEHLRVALSEVDAIDHMLYRKIVEALVWVLRETGREQEISELLQPMMDTAKAGRMIRLLLHLQRLAANSVERGEVI